MKEKRSKRAHMIDGSETVSQFRETVPTLRLKKFLSEKVRIREQIAGKAGREITESIDYARKIQEAVLPDTKNFESLFSDFFLFYQPRNIVSGDFYWCTQKKDLSIIVVADCTGHGVPGAFMSMLGIMQLNLIVNEKNIFNPAEILANLHLEIRKALKQYEETIHLPDGIDLSVCTIDRSSNELHFAGANHSLFYLENNSEVTEVSGDKYGIGGIVLGIERIFKCHKFHFTPGSKIYFTSDGFKDQFGGERNKKFSKKKFIALLNHTCLLPMPAQRAIIAEVFNSWKGVNPQTDDVIVFGAAL